MGADATSHHHPRRPGTAADATAASGGRSWPARPSRCNPALVGSHQHWSAGCLGSIEGPVLDVFVFPADPGGPASVAARYADESLRPSLAQVAVGEAAATTLAGGVPAVRFGYVGITHDGVPIEGVVVAASGSSVSAVFDAYAPQGELATVADDVRAMFDGAAVR